MLANKTKKLAPFSKMYEGMKIIIIQILYLKNVVPLVPISRNFQYHHFFQNLQHQWISTTTCPKFLSH